MERQLWRNRWQGLLDGFFFIPGMIALAGALLAILLLLLDHAMTYRGQEPVPDLAISPTAIQSLLATITASLITVTGLIYSITIVTLQLTSTQFTPRALRGILADRINQIVAGGLVGTYAYCLIVLINIRVPANSADRGFVPDFSVYGAILLTFVSVALLLIFIQHTARSIQVAYITAGITRRTLHSLTRPYSKQIPTSSESDGTALVQKWYSESEPAIVYASRAGNVQAITLEGLTRLAKQQGLHMYLAICPGDFVTPATAMMYVWPASALDQKTISRMQRMVSIAQERNLEQDAAFGVRQLADICLRALSPAVNDPTTAVLCIGYLQTVLEPVSSQMRFTEVFQFVDDSGTLVARYRPLQEYAEILIEIGRYATGNARVVIALLEAISKIAEASAAKAVGRWMLFQRIGEAVVMPAIQAAQSDLDRNLLESAFAHFQQQINALKHSE